MLTNDAVAQLAALKCDVLVASVDIGSAQVTSLAGLESIREITGTVKVSSANKLSGWGGFSGLQIVTGDFSVTQSTGFTTLALPALKQVSGQLSLVNLQTVTGIQLPALASVGQLLISGCPLVPSIRMDQLKTVGSELNINLNDSLATLYGLPALTSAAKLIISSNPKLPQCEVDAIHARVGSALQCSCNNNDTNGTCN